MEEQFSLVKISYQHSSPNARHVLGDYQPGFGDHSYLHFGE